LADSPAPYIQYAQIFGGVADGYLIGDAAHPHVTLVQFNGEQADYDAVVEFLSTQACPQPRMLGIHFGFNKNSEELLWASLTVARDPEIVSLHENLIKFLEQRSSAEILTFKRDLYDPHLTLALIKASIPACPRPSLPHSSFSIAAGVADSFGQFVEIKKVFNKQLSKDNYRTAIRCCL